MVDGAGRSVASRSDSQTAPSCFAQVGRTVFGPLMLMVLGILILRSQRWTLGALDAAYWLVVCALVALRWAEARGAGRASVDADAAARRAARRYSVGTLLVCAVAWTAAQSVQVFP